MSAAVNPTLYSQLYEVGKKEKKEINDFAKKLITESSGDSFLDVVFFRVFSPYIMPSMLAVFYGIEYVNVITTSIGKTRHPLKLIEVFVAIVGMFRKKLIFENYQYHKIKLNF